MNVKGVEVTAFFTISSTESPLAKFQNALIASKSSNVEAADVN
jgi:hypothetical protein